MNKNTLSHIKIDKIFAEEYTLRKKAVKILYLMRCPQMNQQKIINLFRRYLSKVALKDAFVLTCDRMRKYEGAWHMEQREAFPECIFLETDMPECLFEEMKKYADVIGSLTQTPLVPVMLSKEEEQFIENLFGSRRHLTMSKGYIMSGKAHVTDGPLYGREEMIQKIDRHRRTADVPVPSARQLRKIRLGLEITEKR